MGNVVDIIRTGNVAGKRILITGASPLGLMTVAVSTVFGASRKFISKTNKYCRELAIELDVDEVIDPMEDDLTYAIKYNTIVVVMV